MQKKNLHKFIIIGDGINFYTHIDKLYDLLEHNLKIKERELSLKIFQNET